MYKSHSMKMLAKRTALELFPSGFSQDLPVWDLDLGLDRPTCWDDNTLHGVAKILPGQYIFIFQHILSDSWIKREITPPMMKYPISLSVCHVWASKYIFSSHRNTHVEQGGPTSTKPPGRKFRTLACFGISNYQTKCPKHQQGHSHLHPPKTNAMANCFPKNHATILNHQTGFANG